MPGLLVGGLASLLVGLALLFIWLGAVLALVKALIPLGLISVGALAAYLGWEEFREMKNPPLEFSSSAEATRYRAEAKAYQTELNELELEDPNSVPEQPPAKPDAPLS